MDGKWRADRMDITEEINVYYCEHYQKEKPELAYINIYAGETVRFVMCRLCSTMALGTIVSARIMEGIRSVKLTHPNVAEEDENG